MTPKATVTFVKATGNVLGVVTHEGDPERGRSVAEVAGDAFPVREEAHGEVLVDVPAAELDTTAVAVIDDLLLTPQHCVVEDGAAQLGSTAAPTAFDITSTGITVTVDASPDERKVRVFVEHGQGSQRARSVHAATIPEQGQTATITATFAKGDYDVVAAVPGHMLLSLSKTL